MTNVGWVGLGKLGLPCALVLAEAHHEVYGYDPGLHDRLFEWISNPDSYPMREEGLVDLLKSDAVERFHVKDSLYSLVHNCEVIFVAVQTPHEPGLDGSTSISGIRPVDFEYSYLKSSIQQIKNEAVRQGRAQKITIVVVSTVLPGTMRKHIEPMLVDTGMKLVYNPFFIAMGTTIHDFKNPEFVLLGARDTMHVYPLEDIYNAVHQRPSRYMRIESAELTKVAYNTYLSMKIVFGNTLGEICDGTGADADEVIDALGDATDRLLSTKYMRAGMGDGGGCHGRDNIAMSWLAGTLGLSVDLMGFTATAREQQTVKQAHLLHHWCQMTSLQPVILGKAYKPESDLDLGSPALLLADLLRDHCHIAPIHVDPHIDGPEVMLQVGERASVFFIGTNHPEFHDFQYPRGSVVIDPFGQVAVREGVTLVRPGRQ